MNQASAAATVIEVVRLDGSITVQLRGVDLRRALARERFDVIDDRPAGLVKRSGARVD